MSNLNLSPEAAKNWKTFVADYVVHQTRTKEGQEIAGGHRVTKKGDRYQLLFGGRPAGHQPMTAADLYSWMERTPLKYFAREADDLRVEILAR